MKNLHDLWSKRLQKYIVEVQNYLKYIFTGHIAVVLLFAIGAAGYAYSDWVQNISPDFPGAWVLAAVFGLLLAYSPPSTLLKRADAVYFLPLESKLDEFLKPALKWSFFSQLYFPIIAFVVSLPMVNALYGLNPSFYIGFLILLLLLKWWNIQTEFAFRQMKAGEKAWMDRCGRFLAVALFVYFYVEGQFLIAALVLFALIFYGRWTKAKTGGQAFAYEHFIDLEENRMLRFYQFANYFMDVPHIKGKIKARMWLNWVYGFIKAGPQNAHFYLIWRTFIRSDELFYLWVRLTLILMVGAWLIPFPIAIVIFAAALGFASAIQLQQGLTQTQHFRMDQLFPLTNFSREAAVRKLIVIMQALQAALTAIVLLVLSTPVLALAVFTTILAVSALTVLLAKKKK